MKEPGFSVTTGYTTHSREYVIPDDRNIYRYCIFIIVIMTLKPITMSVIQGMLEQSYIAENINNFLSKRTAFITAFDKISSFDHVYNLLTSTQTHTHTHTHTTSSFNIIILYVLTYTKVVSFLEHFDRK